MLSLMDCIAVDVEQAPKMVSSRAHGHPFDEPSRSRILRVDTSTRAKLTQADVINRRKIDRKYLNRLNMALWAATAGIACASLSAIVTAMGM